MKNLLRSGTLLFLVCSLVGCDHITKEVAKTELEGSNGVALLSGLLRLVYTENRDVGFNLLRWVPDPPRTTLLLVLGISASVLLVALLFGRRLASRWQLLGLCLIAAGAVGNTLDRVLRGYVVDFVHLPHWPVFNLADIYVTFGALALFFTQRVRTRLAARR
jgi:signal peptidase II